MTEAVFFARKNVKTIHFDPKTNDMKTEKRERERSSKINVNLMMHFNMEFIYM